MSAPTAEQAQNILERISTILDEFDDSAYSLQVLDADGRWQFCSRASPTQKTILARGLLEEAIEDMGYEEIDDGCTENNN